MKSFSLQKTDTEDDHYAELHVQRLQTLHCSPGKVRVTLMHGSCRLAQGLFLSVEGNAIDKGGQKGGKGDTCRRLEGLLSFVPCELGYLFNDQFLKLKIIEKNASCSIFTQEMFVKFA